ncbi:transcription antitermination factor NusB [Heliobacterium gestii]|uniref:Transcription antitermination protein NusB n=1 Tax=Heliomicrobium gestii TaxID=2699 RepID=A0A845LD09_HELGE|nr:transcription antitermination factor NusB [Heliomicrobium gestii]MBM7867935.1 N utilization substance protein B [Heliomicrobium gestii]MZP43254.1 transcription antitermination factor NusB [Heliomicrobium gestii]
MSRRLGRETALQTLFMADVGRMDPAYALQYASEEFGISEAAAAFAKELVDGAVTNRETIDANIRRLAKEWHLERMPHVDRNLLRVAIFEMLFRKDIPLNAAINEAIELAKIYANEESAKFVNGILGQLARELREARGERAPAQESVAATVTTPVMPQATASPERLSMADQEQQTPGVNEV